MTLLHMTPDAFANYITVVVVILFTCGAIALLLKFFGPSGPPQ